MLCSELEAMVAKLRELREIVTERSERDADALQDVTRDRVQLRKCMCMLMATGRA